MNPKQVAYGMVLVLGVVGSAVWASEHEEGGGYNWDLERSAAGNLPKGWKVEATQQDGPLAAWEITEDASAPIGGKVLTLTSPNHNARGTFNLCWTDKVSFTDGEIGVQFKANSGKIDQGGGPIWRVRDKDNYYICRANPLETNLRLYYVKDGKRVQLATAEDLDVPAGKWHELEIEHVGKHIVCLLNDVTLLEVDDETFPEAGGVGLWTKADAATSFDGFEVEPGNDPDEDGDGDDDEAEDEK